MDSTFYWNKLQEIECEFTEFCFECLILDVVL